jgi:endonuclease/exonuclease/phosphatase family metal-dependent hydrolase
MRLVNYNIRFSKGRDGRYDLGRIAASIKGADIISLQEVERNWPRTAMADQPAEIAALLPNYYWVYGPAFDMDASTRAADGTVINRRRQFGNMVLARWPVEWSRLYILPKLATAERFNMDVPAIEAVINAPNGSLRVLSIHLSAISSSERQMQIDYLLELHGRAADTGGPWCGEPMIRGDRSWAAGGDAPAMPPEAIWMGDFNFQPDSAEYHAIVDPENPLYDTTPDANQLVDCWTAAGHARDERISFPSNEESSGDKHLDYCFASASLAERVRGSHIDMDAAGSDHQPVWVEIDL